MNAPRASRQRQQTERLMNLLIALRAARGWVSRKTLMSAIDGYAGLDDIAFDRKFSRDKELLRHMGITIATRAEHDAYSDTGETGYRISADDYAMDDVELTPAEAAAVAVAAQFWSDTELGESSSQALTKLRALGIDLTEAGPGRVEANQGPAARKLGSVNFATALHHINAREAISFKYHKPGQSPRKVKLEPYALLSRGDRVYLLGHDIDRGAQRTFRLSRVEGKLTKLGGRDPGDYEIPADFAPHVALNSSTEMAVVAEAKLRIRAHRADPLVRRQVRTEDDAIIVEFTDAASLAAEIVSFGTAVVVLEPAELVQAVDDRRHTVRESLKRLGGRNVLSA
ncbi:MAG: helix-turn-helix transcriptional regulator [Brevibacterium aurantiacum]|nr:MULTISPECIES: WYL domain-containing protein [Brevibacterium]MDN5551143.1 WYL domain-containing protein [Brevibacterium sp.]MDN5592672.1 WYL domain-containing protein [Brevibacterium sp.]MDN5711838.1 WYL domain-containing protein [Brevibacterium aurantiacum]MDN5737422.1 WYL domain-containing protein [Brevibacterium aurantiacum]MDN5772653.1 WYL domain-containing protein [Brevibacterium aurantiacum]